MNEKLSTLDLTHANNLVALTLRGDTKKYIQLMQGCMTIRERQKAIDVGSDELLTHTEIMRLAAGEYVKQEVELGIRGRIQAIDVENQEDRFKMAFWWFQIDLRTYNTSQEMFEAYPDGRQSAYEKIGEMGVDGEYISNHTYSIKTEMQKMITAVTTREVEKLIADMNELNADEFNKIYGELFVDRDAMHFKPTIEVEQLRQLSQSFPVFNAIGDVQYPCSYFYGGEYNPNAHFFDAIYERWKTIQETGEQVARIQGLIVYNVSRMSQHDLHIKYGSATVRSILDEVGIDVNDVKDAQLNALDTQLIRLQAQHIEASELADREAALQELFEEAVKKLQTINKIQQLHDLTAQKLESRFRQIWVTSGQMSDKEFTKLWPRFVLEIENKRESLIDIYIKTLVVGIKTLAANLTLKQANDDLNKKVMLGQFKETGMTKKEQEYAWEVANYPDSFEHTSKTIVKVKFAEIIRQEGMHLRNIEKDTKQLLQKNDFYVICSELESSQLWPRIEALFYTSGLLLKKDDLGLTDEQYKQIFSQVFNDKIADARKSVLELIVRTLAQDIKQDEKDGGYYYNYLAKTGMLAGMWSVILNKARDEAKQPDTL